MNEKEQKSLDDRRKEAEIEKIVAETRKTELERHELEQNRNRPWYKPTQPFRAIIQAVVAGVVSVPLIWFFFSNIFIPLSNKENYELIQVNNARQQSLDAAIEQNRVKQNALNRLIRENALIGDRLNLVQQELIAKGKELVIKEQNHLTRITDFQKRVTKLSKELKQKENFEQTVQQIEKDRGIQQSLIDSLNKQIAKDVKDSRRRYDSDYERALRELNKVLPPEDAEPLYFLRKTPKNLSKEGVRKMVVDNGFFHRNWNKKATGINHQYDPQTINGDNIIIDLATNRTWQQSGSLKQMFFKATQGYIRKLNRDNFAGYNDWRLPTLEEAMSLMAPVLNDGGLFIHSIFDGTQRVIWTSDKKDAARAWYVGFYDGSCNHFYFDFNNFVRAVRGGQSVSR